MEPHRQEEGLGQLGLLKLLQHLRGVGGNLRVREPCGREKRIDFGSTSCCASNRSGFTQTGSGQTRENCRREECFSPRTTQPLLILHAHGVPSVAGSIEGPCTVQPMKR